MAKNSLKKIKPLSYLLLPESILLGSIDSGSYIAAGFLGDLYHQLTSASFALTMAKKEFHANVVKSESGPIGQYWLRFQFLRNSIHWYHASLDILLNVIWFKLYLHKKIKIKNENNEMVPLPEMDSEKNFQTLLTRCTLNNVKDAFKKAEAIEYSFNGAIRMVTENSQNEILQKINTFNGNSCAATVKEWAEKLKHHGNFRISELHHPRPQFIVGKIDSEFARPTVITINEGVEMVEKYQVAFCTLVEEVFDILDFRSYLPQ